MKILHRDSDVVVVEKPSGLLSVPGIGPDKLDSVSYRIRQQFPGCISNPEAHRLDMDTSGIMVLGLTVESHRHLCLQFQNRETDKHYVALLDGEIAGDSGTITLPFRLDVENRPYQMYDEVHGKIGITDWEKIAVENGKTRVAFRPQTGRTHQLRVHSAHPKGLGVPIVDDPLYGNGDGHGKLKLHAAELSFTHPTTGERLTFSCPPQF